MQKHTGYYIISLTDEDDRSVAVCVTHYGEYGYLHAAYDFC